MYAALTLTIIFKKKHFFQPTFYGDSDTKMIPSREGNE